jgi:hypothetical protein
MNGAFGVTYEQLQPKLSLSAGPSATKHGPNSTINCASFGPFPEISLLMGLLAPF